jgi:hypothetical protein
MSEALQSYHAFMHDGQLRPFPVHGDNMMPTLARGDIAIIKPVTRMARRRYRWSGFGRT